MLINCLQIGESIAKNITKQFERKSVNRLVALYIIFIFIIILFIDAKIAYGRC